MDRTARIQVIFAIVLVVLGVLFAIVAITYLTHTANHLPSYVPGKPSARVLRQPLCSSTRVRHCYHPRKYTKRGIAAAVAAAASFGGAWYLLALSRHSRVESAED
jgi:hypothetical protein